MKTFNPILLLAVSIALTCPVHAQPVITQQPTNAVIVPGQSASVSVTASGAGLAYQWFKDGVRLVNQTNSMLSFASFQFTNSGNYSVVVNNANGLAISLPALLSVPNAPLKAWGRNDYGQLGNGTNDGNPHPYPMSVASNVMAVAVGAYHSLFVKADSTVWAMGYNNYGQLGNGTTTDTNRPLNIASNLVAVAAGFYHSLFVKADGTLWAMGYNYYGQLGNGTATNTNRPVSVASNVVAVTGGAVHTLFVKADGTLWSMGLNLYGQLGNGTSDGNSHPVPMNVASNVVAAAAGGGHSLFVKADGTMWAMGRNGDGELGNGTTTSTSWPVSVASNVVAVAAGYNHSLFVKADGTLWTMGANSAGELGNGTWTSTNRPVVVASNVVAVAARAYQSRFVKADGTLWAMGENDYGQLGNGTTTNTNWPVQVPGLTVASLGASEGTHHALVVGALPPQISGPTNQLVNLGQSASFNVVVTNGDGPFTYQWQLNGTNLPNATNASYSITSVALTNLGIYFVTVTGLGGNATGSADLNILAPVVVAQPSGGVVNLGQTTNLSVAATGYGPLSYQWFKDGVRLVNQTNSMLSFAPFQFTNSGSYSVVVSNANGLAISLPAFLSVPNAPLKAWGYNSSGQLGNGTTVNTNRPVVVASNVVAMAAGVAHSLFLKSDGTLWTMGYNFFGQLGNGTTNGSTVPLTVASNVVAVAAGAYHSLFVKSDGTLWTMGWNGNGAGQLGNGTTYDTNRPVCVANNVVVVAAGYRHSLFVKSDGTLWAMGWNYYGQLGNGTTVYTNLPVNVASNVVAVAGGEYHSLFVKSDGTLWTMGYNGMGQLGNGTWNDTNMPVKVASNVLAIAAGSFYSLFVSIDGMLLGTGENVKGQLGIGTTYTNSPACVANNVVAAAAGYQHSLFVKSDGTLWTMGYNASGQLGNGTTVDTNLPVQVPGLTVTRLGASSHAYHSLAVGAYPSELPSTFSVTTINDSGAGSLRQTIQDANSGDTINLSVTGTITLTNGELSVCKNLTLAGPGATNLTLSGNNLSRILYVCTNTTVSLQGLTLANGYSTNGGGIYNDGGTVNLTDCMLAGNSARGSNGYVVVNGSTTNWIVAQPAFGGAIYNLGTVTATNCSFIANSAIGGTGAGDTINTFTSSLGRGEMGAGGAIYNASNTVFMAVQTTFDHNYASGGFGGNAPFGMQYDIPVGGDAKGGAIFSQGQIGLTGATLLTNWVNAGAGGVVIDTYYYTYWPGAGGSACGGAICQRSASLSLLNCTNVGNTAGGSRESSASGGGLYLDSGTGIVSGGLYSDNQASAAGDSDGWGNGSARTGSGGAIWNRATLAVTNIAFSRNNATGANGGMRDARDGGLGSGGAVCNSTTGVCQVVQCTFVTNTAAGGRSGPSYSYPFFSGGSGNGGAAANEGRLLMVNVTLAGNKVKGGDGGIGGNCSGGYGYGGGIMSASGAFLALTNCTIAWNTASGGLSSYGNPSPAYGGGLDLQGGTNILKNSLFAYSTSGSNIWGAIVDAGNNISSDASGGFTNATSRLNLDPLLGPLGNYGGPTLTVPLLAGSPAIDTADTAAAPPTDQRGVSRPSGLAADIGAYEYVRVPIITVTTTNSSGAGSLRQAIADALPGDTINFSVTGIIVLTNGPLSVCKNLTLAGPGATNLTLSGNNASRVLYVCPDAVVTLQDLTIANGYSSTNGGGIYNEGTLNLIGCVLSGNSSAKDMSGDLYGFLSGGAVYNRSILQATNCTFSLNRAEGGWGNGCDYGERGGGALHNVSGATANLVQCCFQRNLAAGGFGGTSLTGGYAYGGGILNDGMLRLWSVTLATNSATGGNGGCGYGGQPNGTGGNAFGGALCNRGVLALTNCIFVENRSAGGAASEQLGTGSSPGDGGTASGGAIYNATNAVCAIAGSTLEQNRALGGNPYVDNGGSGFGGAIASIGTLRILNATFSGNQAIGANGGYAPDYSTYGLPGEAAGGAICSWGITALTNCTLGNGYVSGGLTMAPIAPPGSERPGYGAGICVSGGNTTLQNCLFGGNSGCYAAYQNCWVEIYGNVIDAGHNLTEQQAFSLTNSTSLTGTNALLGPLGNYGGPTPTLPLLYGSPAINAGDTTAAPATDQRGYPRPYGTAADIGAYEWGAAPATPPKFTSCLKLTNNVALQLTGEIGRRFEIHTSTNLSTWTWLATLTNNSAIMFYTNAGVGAEPKRFYKAMQLP
jgi:alpha-tubulin suppressor-like RCC1 family protein